MYFLYADAPLENGILDMEEMSGDNKLFVNGPIRMKGAQQFIVVYHQLGEKLQYQFNLQVQALPDSKTLTLVNNQFGDVDLATFLDQGHILIKVAHRMLIFNNSARFIHQVDFDEFTGKGGKSKTKIVARRQSKNSDLDLMLLSKQMTVTNTNIQTPRLDPFLMDDDLIVHQAAKKKPDFIEKMTYLNRMEFQKMSVNNQYFMFFDQIEERFGIYQLELDEHGHYWFFKYYEFEHQILQEFQSSESDGLVNFEITLQNDGGVMITKTTSAKNEKSVRVQGCWI